MKTWWAVQFLTALCKTTTWNYQNLRGLITKTRRQIVWVSTKNSMLLRCGSVRDDIKHPGMHEILNKKEWIPFFLTTSSSALQSWLLKVPNNKWETTILRSPLVKPHFTVISLYLGLEMILSLALICAAIVAVIIIIFVILFKIKMEKSRMKDEERWVERVTHLPHNYYPRGRHFR